TFQVIKTDEGTLQYVAKLTQFHAQFRAIGVNYNQVVKELHSHFSEKKTLALLYKLEKITAELVAVGQQIIALSEEFNQRW
ncbi:MAG: MobA protein, partial [Prevotella sp.]|nr:MobA protein [Prevotella sp.]